ncbi:hypothetical protein [Helicobacter enhydrae]|uniref:hypothetical protein n=1 Tax=Helicobacter enhydrae TaxID=222136 RepID=UPI0019017746|nr:hypothetical protein [Helicobacter enhydrae]
MQNSISQIEELLLLIVGAKEDSLEMLKAIDKLSAFTTQMQGRNSYIQHCLQEQLRLFALLAEQNPQMPIFQSAQDQIKEALTHSLALDQLGRRCLEVLDVRASSMQGSEGIGKAQTLLKSVIACLDMLIGEKIKELNQITSFNQSANQDTPNQSLQNLKLHFKGK